MNWVVMTLIAAEILFWVVIVLGLVLRYVLRLNKVGLIFLSMTPVIDLILIMTMTLDLLNGAKATVPHGIAAVYIGVSLAFGKQMIRWADERFKYYVLKVGHLPVKKTGIAYAKAYFVSWLRHVLAYLIGTGLLWLIINIVGHSEHVLALYHVIKLWTIILGIDLLISLSYFIWQKPQKG
ncbi:hypothetical protein [Staphylococcus edaphicus]|uniref:Uncharacterized protein n=1 Tax=Staphylococcus edaphicus TaxID=1955013 RepID=A0A2C6VIA9_9STAP|nr:hypothetical protein [Staphylococcus edaphicus]PHK49961.1 hypothetical protein BTJ66_05500 [Staphylococcus edaphicus]UQW81778.1 hypothetical protein MNY58_01295 [Staphylococcus edaphicus]